MATTPKNKKILAEISVCPGRAEGGVARGRYFGVKSDNTGAAGRAAEAGSDAVCGAYITSHQVACHCRADPACTQPHAVRNVAPAREQSPAALGPRIDESSQRRRLSSCRGAQMSSVEMRGVKNRCRFEYVRFWKKKLLHHKC